MTCQCAEPTDEEATHIIRSVFDMPAYMWFSQFRGACDHFHETECPRSATLIGALGLVLMGQN